MPEGLNRASIWLTLPWMEVRLQGDFERFSVPG